jgi:hypothetical protein
MPMSFGLQSRIHLAAVRLTWHGDARHVIQRMPSPRIPPTPHHDLTAFAPLSRHRRPRAMRAHPLRVPFGQRLGGCGKHPGRDLTTDPGEGLHHCDLRGTLTLARLLSPGVQQGADPLAPGLQLLSQDA